MPKVACPHCRKSFRVDPSKIGHRAKCACGGVFTLAVEEDIYGLAEDRTPPKVTVAPPRPLVAEADVQAGGALKEKQIIAELVYPMGALALAILVTLVAMPFAGAEKAITAGIMVAMLAGVGAIGWLMLHSMQQPGGDVSAAFGPVGMILPYVFAIPYLVLNAVFCTIASAAGFELIPLAETPKAKARASFEQALVKLDFANPSVALAAFRASANKIDDPLLVQQMIKRVQKRQASGSDVSAILSTLMQRLNQLRAADGLPPLELEEVPRVSLNHAQIRVAMSAFLGGGFGMHKFALGLALPGSIMLGLAFASCFLLLPLTHLIGVIEGIMYLCKSEEDFNRIYLIGRRNWF